MHFKRSADRRKSRHTRSVLDLVGLQRELDAGVCAAYVAASFVLEPQMQRWPSRLFARLLPNLDAELRNLFIKLYRDMGELPTLIALGKLFQERAHTIPPNRRFCNPAERMRVMELLRAVRLLYACHAQHGQPRHFQHPYRE